MKTLGGFITRPFFLLIEKYYFRKLSQLIKKIHDCKQHDDVVALLGKTSYVEDGKNYSDLSINGEKVKVDYVEVYIKKNYILYLQYAGNIVAKIFGTVNQFAWWNALNPKESFECIVNEHFTKNKQMLNRPLVYETYLSFFSKHFIEKKHNYKTIEKRKADRLLELYNILKDTGRYKTINDIADVLEKSKVPYLEFSKSGRLCMGVDIFALRLALVDMDLRETLGKNNFFRSFLLEKM